MGAVPPRSLESNDQAATIGRELEALLRERWPRYVPAQSLEPATISAVDGRPRVNIHPAHVGDRLVGRRELADRMQELAGSLARLGAQELTVADRRPIAGGERGLVLPELVGRIVELAQVTTVALAYADESRVSRATAATSSAVELGSGQKRSSPSAWRTWTPSSTRL